MNEQEVMMSGVGEMLDMISCLSVYNGGAEVAKKKLTYDEIMRLE